MYESMQVLKNLNNGLKQFLDQGDPRVKEWPLMQSPFPGIVMIAVYIYFVKTAGPRYMKKRQPYNLRIPMVVYNFSMVFANLAIFLEIGRYGWFTEYNLLCQPVDYSNRYEAVKMAEIGWWFYITKFVEFADTIFFVLRKKDSQISALHVTHHSIVPFSLWFGVKFAPGGYNALFPFLNSLVHVVMYTYYGLSALGPQFQKYLFWKKYMTRIQMSQFLIVVVYACALLLGGCEVSKTFIALNIIHAVLFLALFLNFYRKCYGNGLCRKVTPTLVPRGKGKLCEIQHFQKSSQVSSAESDCLGRKKMNSYNKSETAEHLGYVKNPNGFVFVAGNSISNVCETNESLKLRPHSLNSSIFRKRYSEGS